MKTCTSCGDEKDEEDFSRDKARPSGRRSKCKACYHEHYLVNADASRKYHAEWYKKNRKSSLATSKAWRDSNPDKMRTMRGKHSTLQRSMREDIIRRYGGACANPDCSDTRIECLTIDHIDNDGNKWRKIHGTGLPFYKWIVAQNYPSFLQVLCWNCNLVKHFYGRYPSAIS